MKSWRIRTIGEVTTIVNGGTPKSELSEYWNGDVFWITPKDMGKLESIYVSNTSRKISQSGLQKSSAKLIPNNSVILSTRAPIGHLAINQVAMATNQGCRGLVPKSDLDTKFLFYFLKLNTQLLDDLGTGTTFKELSTNSLAGVKIPLPPFPEQKRIVAILDEAFEGIDRAIANTEKNLANARELFESYLNTIFTQKGGMWMEKPIYEVSDVVSGYSFKSSDFSAHNTLKSIKITNVGVREFIRESSSYLPEIFAETYSRFAIPENSIVIALTRSIISTGLKVAVVPSDYHCALLNQRVAALKVDSSLMSGQFLFSYLCTRKVVDYVQNQVNTLMQPNLSINDLRNMLVPAPSLEEQNQIVLRIEALSTETQRLEAIYQQKLAALNELKQSILQKAFAGELTADITNQATEAAKEVVAA